MLHSGGAFRLDDESTWPDYPSGRPHPYTHKGNGGKAQLLPTASASASHDVGLSSRTSSKPSSYVESTNNSDNRVSGKSSNGKSSNDDISSNNCKSGGGTGSGRSDGRSPKSSKAQEWGSEYPIQLYDDHSECQAVCCAAIDSALDGRVHWGHDRTHWSDTLVDTILHSGVWLFFFLFF